MVKKSRMFRRVICTLLAVLMLLSSSIPALAAENGQQALQLPEGTYTGEVKNGKPDGEGVMVYKAGDAQDRRRYEGSWKNGKPDGDGVLYGVEGDSYTGQFKAGKMSGLGLYTWPGGDCHFGEFKDNAPCGWGAQHNKDGIWVVGTWYTDKRAGEYYAGYLSDLSVIKLTMDTTGELIAVFPGGEPRSVSPYGTYQGGFYRVAPMGYGVLTYGGHAGSDAMAKGRVCCAGTWSPGYTRNGVGATTYTDGSFFVGNYSNEMRSGEGTYVLPDGSVQHGKWVNDKLEGEAVTVRWDGTSFTETYKDGKVVSSNDPAAAAQKTDTTKPKVTVIDPTAKPSTAAPKTDTTATAKPKVTVKLPGQSTNTTTKKNPSSSPSKTTVNDPGSAGTATPPKTSTPAATTPKKTTPAISGPNVPDAQAFSRNMLAELSRETEDGHTCVVYSLQDNKNFVQEYVKLLKNCNFKQRDHAETENISERWSFDYTGSGSVGKFTGDAYKLDTENISLYVLYLGDGSGSVDGELQIWYASGFSYLDTGDRTSQTLQRPNDSGAGGGGSSDDIDFSSSFPSRGNGSCSYCGGKGYKKCLQCDGDGTLTVTGNVPRFGSGIGGSFSETKRCTKCDDGKIDCPFCDN